MHFTYIKVPLQSWAGDASDGLHDALEQALTAAGAGELVSWGTSLASAGAREDDPHGFHRVDVELQDLERGLGLLREALVKLGVPQGTELHFTAQGAALQQSLSDDGWGAEVPSQSAHRHPFAKRNP